MKLWQTKYSGGEETAQRQSDLVNSVLALAPASQVELVSKRLAVTLCHNKAAWQLTRAEYTQTTSRSPIARKPSTPVTPKAQAPTEPRWYSDPKPSRTLSVTTKQNGSTRTLSSTKTRERDRSSDNRLLELATANGRSKSTPNEQAAESSSGGMTIRGLAGPYVVMASNFAPGTTSADIESAMVPIGGEMQSCRIMSSSPTVIAEMVFLDKKGADAVIETFNNQKVCFLIPIAHLLAD